MSDPSDIPESTPASEHVDASFAGDGEIRRQAKPGRKRRKSSASPKPRERVAPGGPRHLARITAMQVLYEIDVADHSAS